MKVLSLFDGISCGQVALERAGIEVEKYFASEIDKYSIQITQKNYPNTIQLGNIKNIDLERLGDIDLLIGGSPCRNLSKIATQGGSLNWKDFKEGLVGDSALFFNFLEILRTTKPRYFLFENVNMSEINKKIISKELGCEPTLICSSRFSAQNRKRLYWTNIPIADITGESSEVISHILEDEVDEKYFYNLPIETCMSSTLYGRLIFKFNAHDIARRIFRIDSKSPTLTSCRGGNLQKKVFINGRCRKLTPLEYERLQTLPDNYTKGISDSQRYNTLGDGWTVDVIAHIFKGLKLNSEKEVKTCATKHVIPPQHECSGILPKFT